MKQLCNELNVDAVGIKGPFVEGSEDDEGFDHSIQGGYTNLLKHFRSRVDEAGFEPCICEWEGDACYAYNALILLT